MVLMTGYEMPLRAIREQVASAVDLIVHTARLKDGSRRIVNITEVYGIEEDEILTQGIFAFEQTGVQEGRIIGELKATGIRPTFMGQFVANGVELPPGEFGIPGEDFAKRNQRTVRPIKSRWGGDGASSMADPPPGLGKAVQAGGMVYVTTVGPVDPATGRVVSAALKDQVRQCLANLKDTLEREGTSLDRVVWANWCLRDQSDFDTFMHEWAKWFPGDQPVGQGTLMPALQRRAGFRVSIGVIAQA
jgi:enamine deaminase RidA (YjgF/YER057c/UK114 family)